ncbi:hypothetical protein J1N35_015639 [Gossypium stocksii]|uniref:RNase H type-1 domain-containing protein n=1 Tax=Gossypium stocksii TaxID=47602 RepID=A0A9D4A8R8_9ROSI|nr:hypothetical protein J1N35_015639 [Gossypium stocksii]
MDPSSYLLQTEAKDFFRKLWDLQLPSKITITIWWIFWNYILTLVNLRYKRVATNVSCPRCGSGEEDNYHVFRQCPVFREIWSSLNLSWVTSYINQNIGEWLTWVFERSTKEQCWIVCCALWFIWSSWNQFVHERKIISDRDLVKKIRRYLAELEGIREKKLTSFTERTHNQSGETTSSTVQFDVAFNKRNYISASGLVVRDQMDLLKTLKMTLYENISSPFVAEAHAGLEAIKLVISMGLSSAVINRDSKIVIKKCQSQEIDRSVLRAIIRDIQGKITSF